MGFFSTVLFFPFNCVLKHEGSARSVRTKEELAPLLLKITALSFRCSNIS